MYERDETSWRQRVRMEDGDMKNKTVVFIFVFKTCKNKIWRYFMKFRWLIALSLSVMIGMISFFPGYAYGKKDEMKIIQLLLSNKTKNVKKAVKEIVKKKDPSYAGILVEAWFFYRLQRKTNATYEIYEGLKKITGAQLEEKYWQWVEWLGKHREVPMHPLLPSVKSGVLKAVDERFGQFLYPGMATSIRLEEIVWGGVKVNGIPPLNFPQKEKIHTDHGWNDESLVLGVTIGDQSIAYPVTLLEWHELINDEIGGKPVVIVYCSLCGVGIVYDRTIRGSIHTFGTSGLLYRSNKLMFDEETNTLWQALTGKAVVGALALKHARLRIYPSEITTLKEWRTLHPDSLIPAKTPPPDMDYDRSPYEKYKSSPDPMFPVWLKSDKLPPKAWVYGFMLGATPVAYPVTYLQKNRLFVDKVKNMNVLVWTTEGGATRIFILGSDTLEPEVKGNKLVDKISGKIYDVAWNGLVEEGNAENGKRYPRLPGQRLYWFGWYAFHPNTELHGIQ